MKFESFAQLIEAIKSHPEFSNEIKLKRLKKQLDILSAYQNPSTSIDTIELSSVGIQLLVKNKYRQSTFDYKMLLDFQYPFNRPVLFYLKKDSSYAQCKDLLDILLEGSNWGPSLMLTHFLDRLQSISEIIRQNQAFQSKMAYHLNESYRKAFLEQMQVQLFEVQEHVWKYLIKSTRKKMMGLTSQTLLIFSGSKTGENDNLVLDFWKPISELSTAKASVSGSKKFSLEVSFKEKEKETKMYFGGESGIQTILGFLNPIEMIERKVSQIQKNPSSGAVGQQWEDNSEMIREFTQLIEYYSLKDSTKAEKYIKLMKELIAKFYQKQDENQPAPQKMQGPKQQIQT